MLTGHFSVFDSPTTIRSAIEGTFVESIAPGAFKRTFAEQGSRIRVLLEHGNDKIGNRPLGSIITLREDDIGAFYEVELLDAPYVSELVPALSAGLYGASFRFQVVKEDFNNRPKRSEENPEGLPTRRILEARVLEFGPVLWGAYPDATASLRSMTDEFLLGKLVSNPQALERFNLAPKTTAKPVDEGLQMRLAERAAFIASLDEDKGLKARLAERAAYVAEISKPAPAARKRYAWQKLTPVAEPKKKSLDELCVLTDPRRPGYLRGEPECSSETPKLFARSVSPLDGWDVKIAMAVREKFHRFTDDVERATYLTGHRSGRTVYVTGMIGDYAGTRNQVQDQAERRSELQPAEQAPPGRRAVPHPPIDP